MNGQRRRRYFAAGCSFTIAESRRGDWVVVATAAGFFGSKRASWEQTQMRAAVLATGVVQSVNPRPVGHTAGTLDPFTWLEGEPRRREEGEHGGSAPKG